jgi:hypothetical protein
VAEVGGRVPDTVAQCSPLSGSVPTARSIGQAGGRPATGRAAGASAKSSSDSRPHILCIDIGRNRPADRSIAGPERPQFARCAWKSLGCHTGSSVALLPLLWRASRERRTHGNYRTVTARRRAATSTLAAVPGGRPGDPRRSPRLGPFADRSVQPPLLRRANRRPIRPAPVSIRPGPAVRKTWHSSAVRLAERDQEVKKGEGGGNKEIEENGTCGYQQLSQVLLDRPRTTVDIRLSP